MANVFYWLSAVLVFGCIFYEVDSRASYQLGYICLDNIPLESLEGEWLVESEVDGYDFVDQCDSVKFTKKHNDSSDVEIVHKPKGLGPVVIKKGYLTRNLASTEMELHVHGNNHILTHRACFVNVEKDYFIHFYCGVGYLCDTVYAAVYVRPGTKSAYKGVTIAQDWLDRNGYDSDNFKYINREQCRDNKGSKDKPSTQTGKVKSISSQVDNPISTRTWWLPSIIKSIVKFFEDLFIPEPTDSSKLPSTTISYLPKTETSEPSWNEDSETTSTESSYQSWTRTSDPSWNEDSEATSTESSYQSWTRTSDPSWNEDSEPSSTESSYQSWTRTSDPSWDEDSEATSTESSYQSWTRTSDPSWNEDNEANSTESSYQLWTRTSDPSWDEDSKATISHE